MTYSCSTRARPPPGRPAGACAPRPAGWICADAGPRAVGGLLAGWARASTVPSASVHALRTLPRARRDLIQPAPRHASGCMTSWWCSSPNWCAFCPPCQDARIWGNPPCYRARPTEHVPFGAGAGTGAVGGGRAGRWNRSAAGSWGPRAGAGAGLQDLARRSTARCAGGGRTQLGGPYPGATPPRTGRARG